MLKVCFCAKRVDGLTASRQILTSKKDSIKPPIGYAVTLYLSSSCLDKLGLSKLTRRFLLSKPETKLSQANI
jgi:hypothetical protein